MLSSRPAVVEFVEPPRADWEAELQLLARRPRTPPPVPLPIVVAVAVALMVSAFVL